MVATLASMDLYEQLAVVFPGYARHLDAVGATPVEIPFYQCVSLGHMNDPLSGYMFIRKDVVFQVVPDLRDPCTETSLSIWILCAGIHGVPCDPYNPWRAPGKLGRHDRQLLDLLTILHVVAPGVVYRAPKIALVAAGGLPRLLVTTWAMTPTAAAATVAAV
jgi:hypothetical protein